MTTSRCQGRLRWACTCHLPRGGCLERNCLHQLVMLPPPFSGQYWLIQNTFSFISILARGNAETRRHGPRIVLMPVRSKIGTKADRNGDEPSFRFGDFSISISIFKSCIRVQYPISGVGNYFFHRRLLGADHDFTDQNVARRS